MSSKMSGKMSGKMRVCQLSFDTPSGCFSLKSFSSDSLITRV